MLYKLLFLCSFVILVGCGEQEKESAFDIKTVAAPMTFIDGVVPTMEIAVVDRS